MLSSAPAVFAVVSALAVDAVAITLVFTIGYALAKRKTEGQLKTAFAAINRALTELPPIDRERVIRSNSDKVLALLHAATERRKVMAAKAKGDAAAREAEQRT